MCAHFRLREEVCTRVYHCRKPEEDEEFFLYRVLSFPSFPVAAMKYPDERT